MVVPAETGTAVIDPQDEAPAPQTPELVRCPHLGLTWDREYTAIGASRDHRCAASHAPVDLDYQTLTCLTAAYVACPIYQHPPAKIATRTASPRKTEYAKPEKPRNPNAIPGMVWALPILGFATGFLLSML